MNKIKESELNILLEEGELCDYCPYVRDERSKGLYDLCEGCYCEQACEGCYCEQAKDNYVIENDLDYEED